MWRGGGEAGKDREHRPRTLCPHQRCSAAALPGRPNGEATTHPAARFPAYPPSPATQSRHPSFPLTQRDQQLAQQEVVPAQKVHALVRLVAVAQQGGGPLERDGREPAGGVGKGLGWLGKYLVSRAASREGGSGAEVREKREQAGQGKWESEGRTRR